jgi:hypothetical protein
LADESELTSLRDGVRRPAAPVAASVVKAMSVRSFIVEMVSGEWQTLADCSKEESSCVTDEVYEIRGNFDT